MYGKALLFVTLVVVGAVLPYLLADDAWLDRLEGLWRPEGAATKDTEAPLAPDWDRYTPSLEKPGLAAGLSPGQVDGSGRGLPPAPIPLPPFNPSSLNQSGQGPQKFPAIVGPVGVPLENLLSFEITPDWVSGNWSRVSTRTAELDLDGWRVAFLTGNTDHDLAGSITYYFDQKQLIQRILLHAYTADPSHIIQLATSRFSMKRLPRIGVNLFVANVDDKPIGALRVRQRPVVRDEEGRAEILMELNRVGTTYGMSDEFTAILEIAMRRELARPNTDSMNLASEIE